MNITDDEALGFMDRLLEWLRQADLTNFGSHIEVVYVAPGAQHVDKQYIASPPSPLQKARGVDSSEMSKIVRIFALTTYLLKKRAVGYS